MMGAVATVLALIFSVGFLSKTRSRYPPAKDLGWHGRTTNGGMSKLRIVVAYFAPSSD
jgi:hypothetical protein